MARRPAAPGAARPALPAALALAGLLALVTWAEVAEAHGFLHTPRSRNLFAADEGRWWVPASEDASQVPQKESCAHCMNVSVADPTKNPHDPNPGSTWPDD